MGVTPALRTEGLSLSFGALKAVNNVTFALAPGARHALIGPNGAGKTSFINTLTGSLSASAGGIFLGERNITRLPQYERVKRGVTRTFQITTLFPGLTVLESVVLAVCERAGRGNRLIRSVAEQKDEIAEARALLGLLRLERDINMPTRHLPYGKQRLLEIALALATRPKVLLLDEPAAGIPVGDSQEMMGVIADLPREVSILLIEHDMNLVFRFAEKITVMTSGEILAEGTPQQIQADARVREVYLGEAAIA
jgi:branched-chain amino acid transport system ATP-binding protein